MTYFLKSLRYTSLNLVKIIVMGDLDENNIFFMSYLNLTFYNKTENIIK